MQVMDLYIYQQIIDLNVNHRPCFKGHINTLAVVFFRTRGELVLAQKPNKSTCPLSSLPATMLTPLVNYIAHPLCITLVCRITLSRRVFYCSHDQTFIISIRQTYNDLKVVYKNAVNQVPEARKFAYSTTNTF